VFSRTSSGRSDLERVTRLVENSRFAADIIGEDVRHAGFYGTFMPATDTKYDDVAPCAWNPGDVTTLGWRPNDSPPRFPAALQGWDDPDAGVVALNCLEGRVPRTDVLVIRRVSSTPTPPANVAATRVYVQASQCISDPAPLRVSNDATQFTLRTAACAAGIAGVRRYFVRIYYVANCNDCSGAGDGIPTLKRAEYVDNSLTPQVTSLAEGVQNLQFEYALDNVDNDGVAEQMLTATGVAGWDNVVGVRMHILMRSSEPGLSADTTLTQYDLGPGHTGVGKARQAALDAGAACPDRYRCRALTTTFRLNNVAGRRER
jgi:type IV pilus assembly protein PilW